MAQSRNTVGVAVVAATLVTTTFVVGCAGHAVTVSSRGVCTTDSVRYPDGSLRQMLAPPAPDLVVRAIAPQEVQFDWRFPARPRNCEPALLLLTVLPADPPRDTPYTESVRVTADSGRHTIRFPSSFLRSNATLASAFTRRGLRSPVVRVRIRN